MRKILFYTAMTFAAISVMTSCDPVDKPDDPQENGDKTQLFTPSPALKSQTRTSFTVEWAAIENAVSYTCMLNGELYGNDTATNETELVFFGLEPGTYVVSVRANAQLGSQYSNSEWGSYTHTLTGSGTDTTVVIPDEYQPYIGEWTMTSSKTLKCTWNNDMTDYDMTLSESSMTFDVTIAYDADEECAKITGMSKVIDEYGFDVEEIEAFAQVLSNGSFGLIGGWEIPSRLNAYFMLPEFTATWSGYYDLDGEIIPLYNGGEIYYAYTLTMNQDNTEMSGEGVTYTINETPRQICAFDIAGISLAENGGYYYYPYDQTMNYGSPAGTFTFTKKATEEEE
ncbi:MAG TPA: hypothetical protein IAC04_00545 [Candidatus Coprenecus stercoravium]|uniref:Uncharacterized protein n=1 Tax=Candidatus Coprenecus stercoravium TaxID=2840735 RepID=A0A9D2KA65_9BACT|nr:hypothetical protein [Candidatus Coprenecus stercoravium]